MRCLGLDIGDRRVGVAISTGGILAGGVETFVRTTLSQDCAHIAQLAREHDITRIVCGLPRHLNGDKHEQAEKNELLCNALREAGFEIVYMDERLTSVQADRLMLEADLSRRKRKKNIDKLAAEIILQDYLDRENGGIHT